MPAMFCQGLVQRGLGATQGAGISLLYSPRTAGRESGNLDTRSEWVLAGV